MQNDPIEHEVTFVIYTVEPERVADSLAKIEKLGGFGLSAPRSKILRDLYFDAPDGSLASKKWALRVRFVGDGNPLAALKGPSSIIDGESQKRVEIEDEWSEDFFSALSEKLRHLMTLKAAKWKSDPVATLTDLGMDIIQDRSVHRITKLFLDKADQTIAEMALDAVTYRIDRRIFVHHEVEVEFGIASSEQVRAIITDIKDKYGDELRLWHLSKLGTGIILGNFSKNNLLPFSVKAGAPLTPETYDIIDCAFRNQREK